MKIIVTRRLPHPVEAHLKTLGDVALNTDDTPFSPEELAAALCEADVLLPTVSDRITAEMLKQPDLKVKLIANYGVGFSNIDIAAAKASGVAVTNTPDVLTDATADIALLLILAATRRAYRGEHMLRAGAWRGFSITEGLGMGVQGKTLGIIGMGRIGQALARRATLALDMRVIFYNRSPKGPFDFAAEPRASIEDVMREADVISLHMPGGADGPVITKTHIAAMKPGAYLVNTARGDVIDQPALIAALQESRIAGAGLDVFAEEPHVPEALRALENVTLLPHIGSATVETRTAMGMLAARNVEAFVQGRALPTQVA